MRLFVADTIPPYLLRMRRNIFLFYPTSNVSETAGGHHQIKFDTRTKPPIPLPKLFLVRFRLRKVFLRFREGNISYTRRLWFHALLTAAPDIGELSRRYVNWSLKC